MGSRGSIFVSYSHADTKWLKELDPHIRGLERYAEVSRFDDRQLLGGDDWDEKVKGALSKADIVLLLVTANFIGSEYIHRVELPTALRRRAAEGCILIPILLEACYRKLLHIDDINYLPKDDHGSLKPVAEWRGPRRAHALTQIIEHIHQQIEKRQPIEIITSRTRIDVASYYRRAQSRWSAIDLSALAAPGAVDPDIIVRLSDVFVLPLARRSRPPMSLPRDYLLSQELDPTVVDKQTGELAETWARMEPEPALDLVGECAQRNLVLLGDPGGGKSALTRFILLKLLETTAEGSLGKLAGHLPLLIELRDFVAREAEGHCTDLISYLAYCGVELGFGFDASAIETQLAEQPTLLLVDGLDEVFDPGRRRLVVEQIIGMMGKFPKLRLLVTSRIAGFNDHPFRTAEFALATLVDLNWEQIEKFANDWFSIVFPGDTRAANRACDDLLDAIRRRPQLAAIAGNPMILTIMATVARHRRLARSRAALYSQALDLLCYFWDYKRGLGLSPNSPLIDLQADDTILMLRRIAWRMQEVTGGLRANAISENDLRTVIEKFLEQDCHFEPRTVGRAASEVLTRLQERNWVLTLRGPGL